LFKEVIVPYLHITSEEKEQLTSDPREFVNHIDDICTEQKSSSPKSWAAKFLNNLGEHVPGFLDFSVNFCLYQLHIESEGIKSTLGQNQA
jgi:hypothetical protein